MLSSEELFARTAAFVQHAWNGAAGRFRNFMSYDRRWLDEVGSEDSHARAVWALGAVVRHAREPGSRAWAHGLLEKSIEPIPDFTSPRAWAFALLGLVDYLTVRPEDLRFVGLREVLADRLCDHLRSNRRPGWNGLKMCCPMTMPDWHKRSLQPGGRQIERTGKAKAWKRWNGCVECRPLMSVTSDRSARTVSGVAMVIVRCLTSNRSKRVPRWRRASKRGARRTAYAG